MKKIFKLTALLLLVGALVMGCKGNSDDDGLSGTWTKTITFQEPTDSSWSLSGNKLTFTKTNTSSLGINPGYIKRWPIFVSASTFTGVKVKMSGSSSNGGHGLFFVDAENPKQCYRLGIRNGYVLLSKNVEIDDQNEVSTDLIATSKTGKTVYWGDWQDKINKEPTENTVAFYTAKDGSIKLLVNDVLITSIAVPDIKSFYIATYADVAYEEAQANKTVSAKFNFEKFQTAK